MTVESSLSKVVFNGNGVTTEFPFTFKVWDVSEIAVTMANPQGYAEDVTAAAVITLDEDSGGAVTYLHEGAPLPEGWRLAITRNMPFLQRVDLVSATRFDPQVMEDALDQACAERQELREQLARAVIMPPTSETTPEEVVQSVYDARDAAAASATAASGSASEASGSAALAQAWAQSPTPPDAEDADSKSAKTWAGLAEDSAEAAAASAGNAAAGAALAQAWAESPVPPDPNDPASKSAKEWARVASDNVPIATMAYPGKVKPDGETINVAADGTVSVPAATAAARGIARIAAQAEVQAGAAAAGSPAPAVLDVNDARSLPKATDALFGLGRSATAAEATAGATSGTGPAWITPEELATGLAGKTDGKVTLLGTRTTTGNWSITALTVGKPLYILVNLANSQHSGARLYLVSGGVGGKFNSTSYDSFVLGRYADPGPDVFVTIPSESTVVLNVWNIEGSLTMYAYQ